MDPEDYKVAKKLKERLKKIVPVVDLVVFGSRARGNQNEYSDLWMYL